MRIVNLYIVLFCLILVSCGKEGKNETTKALPVGFEIIDKNGESLITSLKDNVTIAYSENGITKMHALL